MSGGGVALLILSHYLICLTETKSFHFHSIFQTGGGGGGGGGESEPTEPPGSAMVVF